MSYQQNISILIDRFIRREMNKKDRKAFESLFKNDSQLNAQLENVQTLDKGIKYSVLSDLLSLTDTWEEEFQIRSKIEKESAKRQNQDFLKSSSHGFNSSWKSLKLEKWLSFLGVIAFVVLATFYMNHAKEVAKINKVIATQFVHYPSNVAGTISTGSRDISPLKEQAFNLYKLKEYKLAAPLLDQVYLKENDDQSLLFAGISYLASGNISKAQSNISLFLTKHPDHKIAQQYTLLIEEINAGIDGD